MYIRYWIKLSKKEKNKKNINKEEGLSIKLKDILHPDIINKLYNIDKK